MPIKRNHQRDGRLEGRISTIAVGGTNLRLISAEVSQVRSVRTDRPSAEVSDGHFGTRPKCPDF